METHWWSEGMNPAFLTLELHGELSASRTRCFMGSNPWYPLDRKADGPQSHFEHCTIQKYLLPLLGNKHQLSSPWPLATPSELCRPQKIFAVCFSRGTMAVHPSTHASLTQGSCRSATPTIWASTATLQTIFNLLALECKTTFLVNFALFP
jgi:hypothetical protein